MGEHPGDSSRAAKIVNNVNVYELTSTSHLFLSNIFVFEPCWFEWRWYNISIYILFELFIYITLTIVHTVCCW